MVCWLAIIGSRSNDDGRWNNRLGIIVALDAFEPASGGVWFQKLRGATQVHHAAKSVNQCIVPKDAIANFLAQWRGRRAHYHSKTQNLLLSLVLLCCAKTA